MARRKILKTFIINEVANYYILATNSREAEKKFLAAIMLVDKTIHCEVPEREVYEDPENRLLNGSMVLT